MLILLCRFFTTRSSDIDPRRFSRISVWIKVSQGSLMANSVKSVKPLILKLKNWHFYITILSVYVLWSTVLTCKLGNFFKKPWSFIRNKFQQNLCTRLHVEEYWMKNLWRLYAMLYTARYTIKVSCSPPTLLLSSVFLTLYFLSFFIASFVVFTFASMCNDYFISCSILYLMLL